MERVRLWTDGSCLANGQKTGRFGGWAFVAEYRGWVLHQESGGVAETNENRMEVAAVAQALCHPLRLPVEVVTDSHYVLHYATGGTRGTGWWVNRDIWTEIDRLLGGRHVRFAQVKGHRHEFNMLADKLAGEAARNARARRKAYRYGKPQSATSPLAVPRSAL